MNPRGQILLIVVLIVLVLVHSTAGRDSRDQDRGEPLFHYVIIKTDVMDTDQPSMATQSVVVLMDEKAFSEDNLKTLFALLSKRFIATPWLDVFVYTSLDQLDTPEQQDAPRPADAKSKPMDCSHRRAFLARHNGNEFLRYTVRSGHCEMKTVILKGDPRAA